MGTGTLCRAAGTSVPVPMCGTANFGETLNRTILSISKYQDYLIL